MGELNAGTVRDSRAALRRRWRAVFRPRSPPVKRTGIYSVCHSDSELCGCAVLGTVEIWLILRCSSNSTKCALCSAGARVVRANPIEPPTDIAPDPDTAKAWLL